MNIPKILVVKETTALQNWNKHLPVPLKKGEKVIVESDQEDVQKGFVRVRHSGAKSVFSLDHFLDIKGKEVNGIKK